MLKGVCQTVASLAGRVREYSGPLTGREAVLCELLEAMPRYLEMQRLDLWDDACGQIAREEETSPTHPLLIAIWELGWCNMYRAFDSERAVQCYRAARQEFDNAGISIADECDVSCW